MVSSKRHTPAGDATDDKSAGQHSLESTDANPEFQETSGSSELDAPRSAALEEVEQQLARLEQDNGELLDRLQRTLAEFDNYRKRVTREKEDLQKYGMEKMAFDLLPVADNFERALEQAKVSRDIAAVVQGVEMIYKQFLGALEKYNIRPFDSLGESFDPERHEAMAQQEHPEYDENKIMGELQKGYMVDSKLLRPARVIVSRGPGSSEE